MVIVFYKPLMPSVIMLCVIMMSTVMLYVVVHFKAILCLFYANSDANQADLRKISVINEQKSFCQRVHSLLEGF